ncbi:MAG: glycoside hydrolase family 97 protein [Longimicrobiales bacterium]
MRVIPPLRLILPGLALLLPASGSAQEEFAVSSPNGALILAFAQTPEPVLRIDWRGAPLLLPSRLFLALEAGVVPETGGQVTEVARRAVRDTLRPIVPEKRAEILDEYNEISLDFGGGWGMDLRAFDGGVAYRFTTTQAGEFLVLDEFFESRFPGDPRLWLPTEDSFLTHQERIYQERSLLEVPPDTMASTPVLVAPGGLPKVLITEADLRSYPGLYLRGTAGQALRGIFPGYPASEEQVRDRTVRVVEREGFLARTEGPRTFPWRLFVVAEEDRDLVESTLVYQLAPPLELDDPSWIRPGKVAWDWWNASTLTGVDFRSGLNTETYLHFIDFAADHGIEYVILDEGWSDPADLRELNFDMDLRVIRMRAEERGVGLILWVVWKTLEDQFEEALDRFAEWGVAGIKVDFMQRDDQPMVEYYWRVAAAAAERHLLVDFHGAYKPTGLRRAYPNVITREGVLGMEHNKWSRMPDPDHDVTLPFTRMVAGPMDYTPGAMRNAQDQHFFAVFDRPMSMGTRVHQLAMYVVFESPLQMLADSPTNYTRNPECLAFLSAVPTTWDETHVLSGEVGEWIALARRKGEEWYVGVMTDWVPRDLELDLSFLGEGGWTGEVFSDGANVQTDAEDYRRTELGLDPDTPLTVHLGPGGGWVARIRPGG